MNSMHDRIYMDYNASSPVSLDVVEKMHTWLAMDLKNPSSAHSEGREARNLVEKARRTHLQALGASKANLVFTSGGTEANNMILEVMAKRAPHGKRRLVISAIEHSSVRKKAEALKKTGISVDTIPVSRHGEVDMDHFTSLLDDDVFLVSTMLANNETGFVLPVFEMAKICREKNIPIHTDAVCALGKLQLSFDDLGVDFLSLSAHKYGGLKGVGGLVFKRGAINAGDWLCGGSHEQGYRAGTENVLGILASECALTKNLADLNEHITKMSELRGGLVAGLKNISPDIEIIASSSAQLPQTVSVVIPSWRGPALLAALDLEGVAVSYGSACASGALEPSPVMLALGLDEEKASSAIRISFGRETTSKCIDVVLQKMSKVIQREYVR